MHFCSTVSTICCSSPLLPDDVLVPAASSKSFCSSAALVISYRNTSACEEPVRLGLDCQVKSCVSKGGVH